MNFFGHAVVAARRRPDRAFVLGSMLPDFATMIRARPPGTAHAEIGLGVELHHRTDDVFHRCPTFLGLSRSAFGWLLARGLGRGSARAVAHIGVEMLLELPLGRDAAAQRVYLAALDAAAEPALGQHLRWASEGERARFERLRTTLRDRGGVAEDVAPDVIAARLERALSGRPRLALDGAAATMVRDWVVAARPAIARQAEPVLHELALIPPA